MPPTSRFRAGKARRKHRQPSSEAGIILLDVVLTLALFGLIALLVMPSLPHGTSASRHSAYAAQVAAVMKNDRSAAARQGREISTRVDVTNRKISSGSSDVSITLPSDITLDVVASQLCADPRGGFAIRFAADGRSCGAIVHLVKDNLDWRIRVNWLTGLIDIVAPGRG